MARGTSEKRPNEYLKRERKRKFWTQSEVASELCDLCSEEELDKYGFVDEKKYSTWEVGKHKPDPFWQSKLCELFGKNPDELGFIDPPAQTEVPMTSSLPASNDWMLPLPSQPYLAHPYPLQENFTGRTLERQLLTNWLIEDRHHSVLTLTALGGMGKSALTWTWLQEDVLNLPDHVRPVGVLWWSLYEAEAYFSTFLNHALTYASSGTINPKTITSIYEKIQILISLLECHNFLFILDGFERELRAYASLTSIYSHYATSEDTQRTFRMCTDPHTGSFLRWLASSSSKSKVLLTSRLFPRELDGLLGCRSEKLSTLQMEDAIAFLHAQGVHGTRAEIQAACTLYGNHPLTLRLLAGLIVYDPARPGDILVASDYSLIPELVQRDHHILTFAYEALRPSLQELLSRLAAFRSAVDFEIVKVVNPFTTLQELKMALRELVERGLIFFDRDRSRYDLHPIVRSYAYARLERKEEVHSLLANYFQSKSKDSFIEQLVENLKKIRAHFVSSVPDHLSHIERLEDLADVIEFYHHLIQAKQFERAFSLYYHSLASLLYHRLGAYQIVVELLQAFLSDEQVLPSTLEISQQSWILDALANTYSALGHPQRAVQLLQSSIRIDQELDYKESIAISSWNLAVQQLVLGRLSEAERNLQESVTICLAIKDKFNEAKAHQYFALLRAYQGLFKEAQEHLDIALSLSKEPETSTLEGTIFAYQALCYLLDEDIYPALTAAQRAYELGAMRNYERDIIRAKWLLGLIFVRLAILGDQQDIHERLQKAELHLSEALSRCRKINMVDYEADLLLAWARLYYAKGDKDQAKKTCTEALAITKRSDFRVLEADVYNLLALLEFEDGNLESAIGYAQVAIADATCEDPPYCYLIALEHSQRLLDAVSRRK